MSKAFEQVAELEIRASTADPSLAVVPHPFAYLGATEVRQIARDMVKAVLAGLCRPELAGAAATGAGAVAGARA